MGYVINNNLLEQLNQLFIEFSTRCEWNYLSIGEIAEKVAMISDGCEYPYYVLSQRQFYLRCNTMMVAPEYVLLFFHSKQGQHELLSYANQTGVPSIAQPASNLKKICLPIPPISEQKKWLLVVEPIIAMYQNNYQETKRLSILRDTLLPKLMSGDLDVSNIDI